MKSIVDLIFDNYEPVYLSHKFIHSENVNALSDSIKSNSFLTHLIFTKNIFENEECRQTLFDAIARNDSIKIFLIEMESHHVSEAIIKKLLSHSTLENLSWVSSDLNGVTEKLAQALQSSNITTLNIGNNRFTVENTELLLHAINRRSYLHTLDLSLNKLGKDQNNLSMVFELLARNTCITQLSLSANSLDDSHGDQLAMLIKENRTLVGLNLSSNRFSHITGQKILDALRFNTTIKKISLMYCNLDPDFIDQIDESLQRNCDHQKLLMPIEGERTGALNLAKHQKMFNSANTNVLIMTPSLLDLAAAVVYKELTNESVAHLTGLIPELLTKFFVLNAFINDAESELTPPNQLRLKSSRWHLRLFPLSEVSHENRIEYDLPDNEPDEQRLIAQFKFK